MQSLATKKYLNYKLGYTNYKLVMKNPQDNEMRLVLSILKSPEIEYHANNLAGVIGVSSVGALKIARKLEKEGIIISRKVGKAIIYGVNLDDDYVRHYLKFILKKEAKMAPVYAQVWIRELKKIKSADGIILFGSILRKGEEARDIDALIVVNQKSFGRVKKEIENIDLVNVKKIHPIFQTKEDLEKHINERQKVVLSAIKGIFVSGEDIFLDVLQS